jgi:hypothetical protein
MTPEPNLPEQTTLPRPSEPALPEAFRIEGLACFGLLVRGLLPVVEAPTDDGRSTRRDVMAKRGTKTGSQKRNVNDSRDLSPKARTTRAVSGGAFDSFLPTTQFPTETIRPSETIRPAVVAPVRS